MIAMRASRHDDQPAVSLQQFVSPALTVPYPTGWALTVDPNDPRVVFAAVGPAGPAGVPQAEVLRTAPDATTPLESDLRVFNDLQNLAHPGRRVLTRRPVQAAGVASGAAIYATYHLNGEPARPIRTLDVIIRLTDATSSHLTLTGDPSVVTPATVNEVLAQLQVRSPRNK